MDVVFSLLWIVLGVVTIFKMETGSLIDGLFVFAICFGGFVFSTSIGIMEANSLYLFILLCAVWCAALYALLFSSNKNRWNNAIEAVYYTALYASPLCTMTYLNRCMDGKPENADIFAVVVLPYAAYVAWRQNRKDRAFKLYCEVIHPVIEAQVDAMQPTIEELHKAYETFPLKQPPYMSDEVHDRLRNEAYTRWKRQTMDSLSQQECKRMMPSPEDVNQVLAALQTESLPSELAERLDAIPPTNEDLARMGVGFCSEKPSVMSDSAYEKTRKEAYTRWRYQTLWGWLHSVVEAKVDAMQPTAEELHRAYEDFPVEKPASMTDEAYDALRQEAYICWRYNMICDLFYQACTVGTQTAEEANDAHFEP